MNNFLKDIVNFANQFLPPITLFRQYQFSHADLANCASIRLTAPVAKIGITSSPSSPRCNQLSLDSTSLSSPTSTDLPNGSITETRKNKGEILTTIDILTYNINHELSSNANRRRHILRAIFSSGAHIILLQETNPSWQTLLQEDSVALDYKYSHYHHACKEKGDRPAGGIAILSQFPLENVQVMDFTRDIIIYGSVFPALICEISVPIENPQYLDAKSINCKSSAVNNYYCSGRAQLRIANVHLRPPVELDGSAWLETARKTEPIRIAEVKELLSQTRRNNDNYSAEVKLSINKEHFPLDIIAGDFNEGDYGGGISHLTSRGYMDALQQFVPRAKETHTWPFMRNFWTLRKRLDHILWHGEPTISVMAGGMREEKINTRARLQCLGCGVLTGYETDASDHQPVLARFAFLKE